MRTLAPIRVRRDYMGDWLMVCRRCSDAISYCNDWEIAMESGLGHLSFMHPQWPQVDNRSEVTA